MSSTQSTSDHTFNRIEYNEQGRLYELSDPVIGGGRVLQFIFDDIQPYLIEGLHVDNTAYEFENYIKITDASGINCSDGIWMICDIPLNHLIPKLSVPELWKIMECHKIILPQKSPKADIHKALIEHICLKCPRFVTIFRQLKDNTDARKSDKVKKYQIKQGENYKIANAIASHKYQVNQSEQFKSSNLKAVKKYQETKGNEYKNSNLMSVKKYQDMKGEKYDFSNLAAVKKYQNMKGEEYDSSNLASVKKYQDMKGEAYKHSNLASVKRYQDMKGEEYDNSNLASVKRYQDMKGEEYDNSNLASVKKYQDIKGEAYKHSNLASVKRYQDIKGEEYDSSNLASVKKYQAARGKQYNESNHEAVKKYQDTHYQQYHESNCTSSKKYQEKQGQIYRDSNTQASKKYQANQGDLYAERHLMAVKKHQQNGGDELKAKNKEAVKKYQDKQGNQYKEAHLISVKKNTILKNKPQFPPEALTRDMQLDILTNACKEMNPSRFTESGCAVCGKLTPISELSDLASMSLNLDVLKRRHVTRVERYKVFDKMTNLTGPVLAKDLDKICSKCIKPLSKGKMPLMSLANGLWVGEVPPQLMNLSFAEQLLIARVRHNRCIVRVSSGMHKMRANAISFQNPIVKVYDILPPPIEEMDDVLAFIYTGPCQPTKNDFERTPFLVRRKIVGDALNWLKLNHSGYYDVEISYRNLNSYPEDAPPVVVDYRQSFTNKDPESTAVHDDEEEEGTYEGKCSFVVHGITGEEYSTMDMKTIKAIALKHLTDNGKILAIGHSPDAESIYRNPDLFPRMMPWLFPYGLGGFGNIYQEGRISTMAHKRHLLMYYDKRFQKDPHFPLIAFNHEQIKQCSSAGYLLSEKAKFEEISQHLFNIDVDTLQNMAKRMENGERVVPETDAEKLCFQVLRDLDHVGGHVQGSLTSKKYMRNEIWSLISYLGAPSWFITLSPADVKHPIALYFADTKETFKPEIRNADERRRLIANNPVAGARFFHFMVQIFITYVLGVGTGKRGIYGNTAAYYGTVEQQGRLTLHLHLLLWIIGSLSPQEIRERIMDPNSDFQKKIVEYLESVHIGEFLTGDMESVKLDIQHKKASDTHYIDPTETLPEAPANVCDATSEECFIECKCIDSWWNQFKYTVDDLIFRSNVHRCSKNNFNVGKDPKKSQPSCINKHGNCKARFPRDTFDRTEVDPKTGALNIKKGEAWINTLTPALTYIFRCNTDVTSLLSGTAVKAVVAYITDYVTKPGLKTYSIFEAIRGVFNRNSELLGGTAERKNSARSLITKIINSLTAKMEIGSPMSSLYLLGNPDHYTSHKFVNVYWKSYVREAMDAWKEPNPDAMDIDGDKNKVVIHKIGNRYVGVSTVYDYIFRPTVYEDSTLFQWLQIARRVPRPKSKNSGAESDYKGNDTVQIQRDAYNLRPKRKNTNEELFIRDDMSSDSDEDTITDQGDITDTESDSDIDTETESIQSNILSLRRARPLNGFECAFLIH
jgi:hypothetical protein